ncbi:hypothetical protein BDBG_03245 [Blastomyces gilchristii SLH14081]|uniref:Uncharacterized protein n=1 Tax=Blastomyces gilchristii (strain SLH14081) TaxID=559298 RepID=A0A179UIS8_BLAGS|nr:uncharacterized protein BDBG_03245 [Blastomyces gilchristii SLH14081]OAT07148.1 hypothetical protein BDBG_03245 [Blastomyces gilchristii SLH14081]
MGSLRPAEKSKANIRASRPSRDGTMATGPSDKTGAQGRDSGAHCSTGISFKRTERAVGDGGRRRRRRRKGSRKSHHPIISFKNSAHSSSSPSSYHRQIK